jgi:signal transduction histidine kinase
MVRKISELRATPDDVLIAEHDRHAGKTVVGTSYYMDELQRRQVERSMQASHRLAVIGLVLSVINAVVAIIAVVIALSV